MLANPDDAEIAVNTYHARCATPDGPQHLRLSLMSLHRQLPTPDHDAKPSPM